MVTAKIGGNAMTWHFRFGYCIFALIVFRLVWGFVGGHWSRFASFIYGPARRAALPARPRRATTSSTSATTRWAAASVFALLAILIVQVATGLVADDEIANVGPLNRFVVHRDRPGGDGVAQGRGLWHHHRAGGAARRSPSCSIACGKKRDLVGPMFSGDKRLPGGVPASADDR